MTATLSKLALATAAVVGLYVPTLGLALPTACAAPSPSCGGDLRECLRLSADMNPPAPFGVRYVTADQVAHCMEAFNSCIHGGASRGGNPASPPSNSQRNRGDAAIPQRFIIGSEHFDYDCSTSGSTINCTTTWKTADAEVDSFSQEITGSLSGMTMTGSSKATIRYHNSAGCTLEGTDTHPISFTFSPGGTVTVHTDAYQDTVNYNCPTGAGTNVIDAPALDFQATWSAK